MLMLLCLYTTFCLSVILHFVEALQIIYDLSIRYLFLLFWQKPLTEE